MKVICISGKARHGKDTAANFLKKKLELSNEKVLIIHYADLLKYICKSIFNWNGVKDDKGRALLQYVGTDVIREQKPNYWVDFVISILELFCDSWDYVLIPDCRFPNEVDSLRAAGFDTYAVKILRDNFLSNLTSEQQAHKSETAMDDYQFDYIIHNTNIPDFYEKLNTLIKRIKTEELTE